MGHSRPFSQGKQFVVSLLDCSLILLVPALSVSCLRFILFHDCCHSDFLEDVLGTHLL